MMHNRLLLLFLLFGLQTQAQEFRPPLNIPLRLTGNFGELRNNHFHGGLDIATDQTTGLPVYACADGYVSRIVVGANGYGKALYITHTNGLTTVCGHLESFGEGISHWVKARQYELEQFELDESLSPSALPVVRGQVVAKSGNTGASGGPHLHFEVRRGDTPLNPMAFGFDIADHRVPEVSQLYVYPYFDGFQDQPSKTYTLVKTGSKWTVSGGVMRTPGQRVGLAVYAWDRQDGRENRNGIYSAEMLVDGQLSFQFKMDSLSYLNRRYLNAHLDYRLNMESQRKVHRLFKLPGNQLGIYQYLPSQGLIDLKAGQSHDIEIKLTDYAGNISTIAFKMVSDSLAKPTSKPFIQELSWREKIDYEADGIKVEIPAGSLYNDLHLQVGTEKGGNWSDRYQVADAFTPLHREATISIKAELVPERYRKKALIINEDHTGRKRNIGGHWENGYVISQSDRLGKFYVTIDSVGPSLTSLNLREGQAIGSLSTLKFRVTDGLSGVEHFRGEIDGHWVLFEYEPKYNLLFHNLDGSLEPGRHVLVLQVTDERGNQTERRISFTR
jgi:murein DD-endopeptidase MepM/ murein hydrolase activator NlpD